MTPDQQKQFFKKTFTLQGRLFHPHLLVANARQPGDTPKFSVMFAWLKQSNPQVMQEINQFLAQAFQALHPTIPAHVLIKPIKDYDSYQREDGKPNPDYVRGHLWCNASSGANFPPAVVTYPDRQPVMSDAEVYSGRNAVVNISFYNLSGANGGKRGIGVNVNAAMLLEGGAKEGGAGSVDVNQIFGSFQADMGLVAQGGAAPAVVPQAPAYAQPDPNMMPGHPNPAAPAQQQYAQPAQQQYAQPAQQQPAQQQYAQPAQQQPATGVNPFLPSTNNPYV